eukprot:TRINITY_DN12378_c0_g1_i1.p1 TRINITY_DN12378_c0_g1~~TRINITY_DN12378_c0_g1_i1.p1  ORF type:complete len:182 (+),score=27.09 TRINITY_DN12378_c0_g1_i1:98-643(+)
MGITVTIERKKTCPEALLKEILAQNLISMSFSKVDVTVMDEGFRKVPFSKITNNKSFYVSFTPRQVFLQETIANDRKLINVVKTKETDKDELLSYFLLNERANHCLKLLKEREDQAQTLIQNLNEEIYAYENELDMMNQGNLGLRLDDINSIGEILVKLKRDYEALVDEYADYSERRKPTK